MESSVMFSLKAQMLLKVRCSDHIPSCILLFVTQKYAESVDTLTFARTTGQVIHFSDLASKYTFIYYILGFMCLRNTSLEHELPKVCILKLKITIKCVFVVE